MKKALFLIIISMIFLLSSCTKNKTDYTYAKTIHEIQDIVSTSIDESSVISEGYVCSDITYVMKDKEINSEIISVLFYGRKINVISTFDNWHCISYNKATGYVKINEISENIPPLKEDDFSVFTPIGESHIENVPVISQFPKYPTGCESVTAVMALNYLGEDISVDEFIDNYLEISNKFYYKEGKLFGPDPYEVFVGNPRIASSFGCMSPVIEKALKKYLCDDTRVKIYKDVPLEKLCAKYIDNDTPVLIWVTIAMVPSFERMKWETENRGTFTWLANEHCMLMVGYDENYYYMNDCYKGECIAYPKEKTEKRYEELGCQAVVIEK